MASFMVCVEIVKIFYVDAASAEEALAGLNVINETPFAAVINSIKVEEEPNLSKRNGELK